jgi:LysM repeat protein
MGVYSLTPGLAGSSTGGSLQAPLVQSLAGRTCALARALSEGYTRMSMKTRNPFIVVGSLEVERQRRRRVRFKIAVWTIVGATVLLVAGLLIQGCEREPATAGTGDGTPFEATSSDTNGTAMAQQTPRTNALVTPTFEAPMPNATAPVAGTNAALEPTPPSARRYVVVKGDSFYKIAKANGISMKALADANPGVDSAKLKIGEVLQLPAGAEPAATSPEEAPARPSTTTSQPAGRYVVKPGDTLERIARAHGTTVRAIKAANRLTSDRIVAGRSLKMPEPKAAGTSDTQV